MASDHLVYRLQGGNTLPLTLQHFLKFSETIKREAIVETSPMGADGMEGTQSSGADGQTVQITVAGGETEIIPDVAEEVTGEPGAKPKRKKKYKKKPPKPKKPKPGQVSSLLFLYILSRSFIWAYCFGNLLRWGFALSSTVCIELSA